VLSVWKSAQVHECGVNTLNAGVEAIMDRVMTATSEFNTRSDFKGWSEIAEERIQARFAELKNAGRRTWHVARQQMYQRTN